MLAYTIVFGLLSILFGRDDFEQYPMAYAALCGLLSFLIFIGNLVYSLNYVTPVIRTIWKFVFPLVVLHFIVTGVVDVRFGKNAPHNVSVLAIVAGVIAFALFLPTFRAHFLLGYGVPRLRDSPPLSTSHSRMLK